MRIFKNEGKFDHIEIINNSIRENIRIQKENLSDEGKYVFVDNKYIPCTHSSFKTIEQNSPSMIGIGSLINITMTHYSYYYKYADQNLLNEWSENYIRITELLNTILRINPSHPAYDNV